MDKLKDYFEDREDALRKLIAKIDSLDLNNTLVLGISKEGSILAHGVACHFKLPLEFLFLSALKAPENPDCVIAFVSEKKDVIVDDRLIDSFEIPIDDVYAQAQKQYEQIILPQSQKLRCGEKIQCFKNKNILIVDEGIETGFSAEIAIKACIDGGCKSVSLASPVLSMDVEEFLLKQCDWIYYVLNPKYFVSTNYYYRELSVLDDEKFSMRYFF